MWIATLLKILVTVAGLVPLLSFLHPSSVSDYYFIKFTMLGLLGSPKPVQIPEHCHKWWVCKLFSDLIKKIRLPKSESELHL